MHLDRDTMSAFDEKRTQCPDYFDLFFSPGAPPATPSFLPFQGANVQLRMLLSNLAKIVLVFSKTGRDYQPPAPVLWGIFMGMAWGVQNMGMGESERRIYWGKSWFSGFFSYSSNYSNAPEGEKWVWGRGLCLGAPHKKKSPGMVNSWALLGSLLGCWHVQDSKDGNISARRNSS